MTRALNSYNAALYLGIDDITLTNHRIMKTGGPEFFRDEQGCARYRIEALQQWQKAQRDDSNDQ